MPKLNTLLLIAIISYLILMFFLALLAKNKVRSETDFLAAGRKLPVFFASTSLFATWFGAGTLLTATDAVYNNGLKVTALEPFGAGSCLLIAGFLFAAPLWKMNILTIPDLFGKKFGAKAETLSAILLIPSYLGWIAVQIAALSGIVNLFFGLPILPSMIAITLLATTLTCFGGMWSITLTDTMQMVFVVAILVTLSYVVLKFLGHGHMDQAFLVLLDEVKTEPSTMGEKFTNLFSYLNVFAIAALGNLPGQDLAQRIFSANSSTTAKKACFFAGALYILLGSTSIMLGLAAKSLLPPGITSSVIPNLAKILLTKELTILLVLAIFSIILSTTNSALLATASIISHNLIKNRFDSKKYSMIMICRACIIFVSIVSLFLAIVGESAYSLLEQSYAISLCGLFIPFLLGIYLKKGHQTSALVSMIVGTSIWAISLFLNDIFIIELIAALMSAVAYYITEPLINLVKNKKPVRKEAFTQAIKEHS